MKKVFFLLMILVQQSYGCWGHLRSSYMMMAPTVFRPIHREDSLNGNGDFPSSEQIECAQQFREKLNCKDPLYFSHFRGRLKILLNKNPHLLKKEQVEALHRLFFEKFCEIMIDEHKKKYPFSIIYFNSLKLIKIIGNPMFSQVVKKYVGNTSNGSNNGQSSPVQKARSAPVMGFSSSDLKNSSERGSKVPSLFHLSLKTIVTENDIMNCDETFYNVYKTFISSALVENFDVRKIFFERIHQTACVCFNNKKKQKNLARHFSSDQLMAIIGGYLGVVEKNNSIQKARAIILQGRRNST